MVQDLFVYLEYSGCYGNFSEGTYGALGTITYTFIIVVTYQER